MMFQCTSQLLYWLVEDANCMHVAILFSYLAKLGTVLHEPCSNIFVGKLTLGRLGRPNVFLEAIASSFLVLRDSLLSATSLKRKGGGGDGIPHGCALFGNYVYN